MLQIAGIPAVAEVRVGDERNKQKTGCPKGRQVAVTTVTLLTITHVKRPVLLRRAGCYTCI